MRSWNWFLIAAMSVAAYAPAARAGQVIVSNLDQAPSGSTAINTSGIFAQEFTTGGSFMLQSVVLSLGDLEVATGKFSFGAELISTTSESEDPGMGTLVGSLSEYGTIPTNGFANIEFDPDTATSLSASSFYWFVLEPLGERTTIFSLAWTDNFDSIGPGSLLNVGSTDRLGEWVLIDADPWLIQVNAVAAVPEPSSLVLGCVGIALLALHSRGRRATA